MRLFICQVFFIIYIISNKAIIHVNEKPAKSLPETLSVDKK